MPQVRQLYDTRTREKAELLKKKKKGLKTTKFPFISTISVQENVADSVTQTVVDT